MTNAPADLLAFRALVRAITGLPSTAVGVVGDGVHQRTGGYHEGRSVLADIGRYHGPPSAYVGSTGEDYSARQFRDRTGLTDDASAVDIGDDWPVGGRAGWLRFNGMLVDEMRYRQGNLPALRAVNVSLDGRTRQRFDQLHRDAGLIASTDNVETHTHLEFWRDTAGTRKTTLDRIAQLVQAAAGGTNPQGDDMNDITDGPNGRFLAYRNHDFAEMVESVTTPQGEVVTHKGVRAIKDLQADVTAIRVAVAALASAGGSVDGGAILGRMDALAAEEAKRDTAAQQEIAALKAELAAVRAAAEANLSDAEKKALQNEPGA